MAATAVQLNWENVTFGSTSITRVTSINFTLGGELLAFAGDNDRYSVVVANNMNRPGCTITSADVATLMSLGPGTSGTISATQLDAEGATGGAINWTLINAVHGNTDDSGPFSQWASATASFMAYSADGQTSPFSFTRS